jgi:hypothetical protein
MHSQFRQMAEEKEKVQLQAQYPPRKQKVSKRWKGGDILLTKRISYQVMDRVIEVVRSLVSWCQRCTAEIVDANLCFCWCKSIGIWIETTFDRCKCCLVGVVRYRQRASRESEWRWRHRLHPRNRLWLRWRSRVHFREVFDGTYEGFRICTPIESASCFVS